MLNSENLSKCKNGVYIINVARGPLIDELALTKSILSGKVAGAALDVFEVEPLHYNSPLKNIESCILGSHNGSNTKDAVIRASISAIDNMDNFFKRNNEK